MYAGMYNSELLMVENREETFLNIACKLYFAVAICKSCKELLELIKVQGPNLHRLIIFTRYITGIYRHGEGILLL